ncbi:cardiolipin synthase [Bacillus oleivorans]|uniref:Cardiolipin synthase n=1 Tax=Bacillus oleivorans TaxID=1448271 RepID=A0A285CH50_9BACI|nr:cardiolipin synthase [Bacillus oleivorans]SNX66927.1 cardiolipin synthase [Bacillus oleivorans]
MIFSILFFILVLICLWLYLDFTYGRKRHVKELKKLNFPERKSDIRIFTDGTDLFEDLFKELETATDHIHVLFYIVQNDAFSERFLQILEDKAKSGVEVRLLLDWIGSFGFKRNYREKLKRNHVQFAFCHVPRFPFFFYTLQKRNHRKITVIDGKAGYVGGYNIGKEYIGGDPKLSPWRDYHLKLQGEGVHDLQMQFLADWTLATKEKVKKDPRYFPPLPKGTSQHRFSATEGVELEAIYIRFINGAKRSFYIGSPYFVPSAPLFDALSDALDRGVEITIVVPKLSDHALVQEASYPYFRKLLKKGAHVYQFETGFFHAKILIRDDSDCDIGTANFDNRSLFLNHELNCYIYDPTVVAHAKSLLLQDISHSSRLTLRQLNQPNFFRNCKEWIAQSISHFL